MVWLFVHYLPSLPLITMPLAMYYLAHVIMYANTHTLMHSGPLSLNTHIMDFHLLIAYNITVFV